MEPLRPVDIAHADGELAFNEFVSLNDHRIGVYRVDGPGAGPWEMHPDTDELLWALEGSVTIEVFVGVGDDEVVRLDAGSLVVVPKGRWHRHVDPVGLVELYYTPGESRHCDDPGDET
jgi:mannose-6-phosphate isomerase-like protein (cupin superfamily)